MKITNKILFAVLTAGALVLPAKAEEQWRHTLAPLYLWASGIEGTSQIGPISAPISIKFEDAVSNLDSGLTLHYEANKGKYGFLADYYYLNLKPEGYLPNGAPAGVDLSNTIIELGGIYRPDAMNGVEVLYGLRSTNLELDASIGGRSRNLIDENWIDFFAGLRGTVDFTDKFSFTGRGDIGAGDSDLVWNLSLLLNYSFTDNVALMGGYRWLDYDYDQGGGPDRFAYDVTYEGPAIALRFDW